MTDIDPKSIPILDDVIEGDSYDVHAHDDHSGDQHAPVAEQASAVEADDLFSPASLLDGQASPPEENINRAADITALEGNIEGDVESGMESRQITADHGEDDFAVTPPDEDTDSHAVPDAIDHIDAITTLDESTPSADDALYRDDILNDPKDDPVAESTTGPDTAIAENTPADTVQAGSSQQPEINTAAVTNQIIDRLMPEIEQRLRVIIDLTLRENIRDRNSEE
jgi:hypothetical protein